jgi:hypothetical protein
LWQVNKAVTSRIRIGVVFCAVLVSGSFALAQTPEATLSISGAVTVNGKPAPQPSAIFSGDQIQTGPDSSATITSEGLEISIPENSNLTFSPENLNLGCGASSIFTKAGKTIIRTQDGATITPNAPDGFNKFEVRQGAGTTLVQVVLGSAVVARGAQTETVRAGYQIELPGSTCVPVAAAAAAATIPPAAASSAASSSYWIPVLIGAGGAGAAAAVLLSREDEEPVSPQRP